MSTRLHGTDVNATRHRLVLLRLSTAIFGQHQDKEGNREEANNVHLRGTDGARGLLWIRPAAQAPAARRQDVRALLQAVSKNIGADNLTTLEYGGAGMVAAPGQGYDPIPTLIGIPESWPRFAVTNYTMTIDYTTMSSREAYTAHVTGATEPLSRAPGPGARVRQSVGSLLQARRWRHRQSGASADRPA